MVRSALASSAALTVHGERWVETSSGWLEGQGIGEQIATNDEAAIGVQDQAHSMSAAHV